MRFAACCLLMVALAVGPTLQSARAQDKMVYAANASSKFANFPGLPTCLTGSVQNGDPSKSNSVILVKTTAGCNIPWHWHTANEELMVVTGRGKGEMKEGSPVVARAGDYLKLPAKSVHQFTCLAACTFFLASDSTFDMHYVDASGKEIPPDEVLKSKAKAPGKKSQAQKEMKEMKM